MPIGSSPLSFRTASAAEEAIDDRDLVALKKALSHSNPNTERLGGFGMTLLHFAVETYAPAISVLLDHGANPLIADTDGKTPRDWCREYSVPASVEQALIDAEHRQRQADEAQALRRAIDDGRSSAKATQKTTLPIKTPRTRL